MITISFFSLFITGTVVTDALSPEELEGWTLIGRDEFMTITGQTGSIGFGSVVEMGDMDGDGRDDIVVGVPTYSGNGGTGAVLIYFARDLDDISPLRALEDADVIIFGEDPGDRFGQNLVIGDMNGDGRNELIISANQAFGWKDQRRMSGEIYIISGRERSEFPSKLWIGKTPLYGHIYGRDPMDMAGIRMVMGDLTGDGLDELVIGTNGAGGFGGTAEFHAGYENNAPDSWEIEVIQGESLPIGNIVLDLDPKMVRYFSSWNSTLTPPATHARHIGKGMDVSDFNGDGIEDLIFSWSRMEGPSEIRPHEEHMSTQIEVITGGPGFPHVPINTTIDIIIPSFDPDLTIQLNTTMIEPPILKAGDLDGDQYLDLVLGSQEGLDIMERMPNAGRAYILQGFNYSEGQTIFSDSFASTIYGYDSSDLLGSSLICSDLDNDGYDEVVIGAPGADGEKNLLPGCGEGYVFDLDGTLTADLEIFDSYEKYMGSSEGIGSFTTFISGDINEDGFQDLLVSSPDFLSEDDEGELGLLSLFMAKNDYESKIYGGVDSSNFGKTSVIDDFNSDGFMDLAIGDPEAFSSQDGGVFLFFGGPTGWKPILNLDFDADIVYKVDLEGNQAHIGSSLTSGDLNDDTYPDLIVGSPSYYDGLNNCGGFNIFWGGNSTYMEEKNGKRVLGQSVEMVGTAVSVGDFNGDNVDDLAVSAMGTMATQSLGRYHAGNVYLLFGPIPNGNTRINSADVVITGSIPNEQIGKSLASGDINNDGRDELVIGAPVSDLGSITDQGVVYIMSGRDVWNPDYDLLTEASSRIFGPWPYDQVGESLALGDLDEDDMDELLIGSTSGDGYQRTTKEAGNVYVMMGNYLSTALGGMNLSLRNQFNMSIFGETEMERLGTSLGVGDLDGNGKNDVAIGSKGWTEPVSGIVSGAVKILPSRMIRDGGELNSSSLPLISSKRGEDLFGTSISVGDLSNDGNDDLLVGAPGYDPYGTGEVKGGAFIWEGEEVYLRDIKVTNARMLGSEPVDDPEGIMEQVHYLSPLSGPYGMRVTGRSLFGYDDVRSISISMDSLHGPGTATMVFNTSKKGFELFSTGDFADRIWIDINTSSGTSDKVESWYVDFSFYVDWDMPDPDVITTNINGGTSSYINYLTKEFRIDRTVYIEDEGLSITDEAGGQLPKWLNASSNIGVGNISLSHVINGERIEGEALETIPLGLYRPDGILIGRTHVNDSRLDVGITSIGEGINSGGANFKIAPLSDDPLPEGSIWQRDLTFNLDVDTLPPAEVSNFNVFPDGKEKGIVPVDDDRFVEIGWSEINDMGPSGINRYILEITGEGYNTTYDSVRPGDLIMIPEGEVHFSLWAVDNARNVGPRTYRTMISDTGAPFFWSPRPTDGSWLNDQQEDMSIMADDAVSGLDLKTAEYRVYYSSVGVVGEWMDVYGLEALEDGTRLVAPIPDEEAFGLYVQWKISDLAGSTTVSEPFTFSKDLSPPIIEPSKSSLTAGPGEIVFECFMEDTLSWLNLSTVEFQLERAGSPEDTPWISLNLNGFRISASPSISIVPGFEGYGYARWRVMDRAGNSVESDPITILVDGTLPQFTDFTPNSSIIQSKLKVEVTTTIIEEGSGLSISDVEISVSTISGWVQYGVGGFSPWSTVESLEEFNNNYIATATVTLDEGRFNLIRFRVKDRAGNGWVISRSHSIEVDLMDIDLPPTALFNVLPVSDMIFKGESLLLDASPSIDPEGSPLNYTWYSDLEGFPGIGLLGKGMKINVTLTALGVHKIWVVVTDGVNTVTSDEVKIRVRDVEQEQNEDTSTQRTLCDKLKDAIIFVIIALLIGLILGALAVYLVIIRRREAETMQEQPLLVDAVYDDNIVVPYCPYCDEEARLSDDYCVKCGSIFTKKDKEDMAEGRTGRSKKKKKESLKAAEEEEGDMVEDWGPPAYEDEVELESEFMADTPDELEIEELEEEDLEEVEELELEELEIEELEEDEWEVEE